VDAAVLRALSKSPGERFATCREFADAFTTAVGPAVAGAEDTQDVDTTSVVDPNETQPVQRTREGSGGHDGALAATNQATTESGGSKLPPLSRVRGHGEEPEIQPPASPWPKRIAIAALFLIALGLGAFVAANPWALRDPGAAVQALLGNEPEPRPTPEPLTETAEPQVQPPILPTAPEASQSEPSAADPAQPETAPPASSEPPAAEQPDPATEPPAQTPPQPEAVAKTEPAPAPKVEKAAPKAAPKSAAVKLVSVYFRTEPIGAEITVDNRPDWTCKTPCRLDELPPGGRQVTAKLAGYYPAARRIDLGANPQEIVQISLEDARVTTLITSEPSGAEIYIDGRKQPEKTNAKIPLPRGTYQVKVVKPGVGEAEQVLVVDKDQIPYAKFVLGVKN
jgi:hypothetical protein